MDHHDDPGEQDRDAATEEDSSGNSPGDAFVGQFTDEADSSPRDESATGLARDQFTLRREFVQVRL